VPSSVRWSSTTSRQPHPLLVPAICTSASMPAAAGQVRIDRVLASSLIRRGLTCVLRGGRGLLREGRERT
jgi:hypothetical protein